MLMLIKRLPSIANESFARKVLQKVSYYRLSGYMLQYRLSSDSHEMVKGIPFETIYKRLIFYCNKMQRIYFP